jgi:hypothetical protein
LYFPVQGPFQALEKPRQAAPECFREKAERIIGRLR